MVHSLFFLILFSRVKTSLLSKSVGITTRVADTGCKEEDLEMLAEKAMEDPCIVHMLFCIPKYWEKKTKAYSGKSDWCKNYQNIFSILIAYYSESMNHLILILYLN